MLMLEIQLQYNLNFFKIRNGYMILSIIQMIQEEIFRIDKHLQNGFPI